MAYKVLIVDDQKMQRIALETSLSENPDYQIVDSIGNAEMAVSFARSKALDLIIMDIVMTAGLNGIEAAATIKKEHPNIKINSCNEHAGGFLYREGEGSRSGGNVV